MACYSLYSEQLSNGSSHNTRNQRDEVIKNEHTFSVRPKKLLLATSPFYSCVLSDLAFEWKRGWS